MYIPPAGIQSFPTLANMNESTRSGSMSVSSA
jgi:hypothetical protein